MINLKKIQNPASRQPDIFWPASILLALIALDLWGGYQLIQRNLWVRMIPVKSLQAVRVQPVPIYDDYRNMIKNQPWLRNPDPVTQAVEALQWTMNQVRKVDYNPQGDDPEALLKSVKAGSGALCGDMADLYRHTLAVAGIPSRKIWLYRDLFSLDTHATVEVFLNGKWVLMSPTFGVYFTNAKNQILSVQELKAICFQGKEAGIRPIFINRRSYPAQMKNYYINYILLYNNVFVVEKPGFFARQIPPFCYWFGTKLYYERLPNESDAQIRFLQQLYFMLAVVVPVLIMIFTGIVIYRAGWKGKRLSL